MKDLLPQCWLDNPDDRPSFDDIFKKLSTDFSYFYETVDEEEVETYLESLKTESSDDMSISKLQIKLEKLKIQRHKLKKEQQIKVKYEKCQTEMN